MSSEQAKQEIQNSNNNNNNKHETYNSRHNSNM